MSTSRLKQARELRGWSQVQLADRVGTTKNQVRRWERGVIPGPYFRTKLTQLFGVTEEALGLQQNAESVPTALLPETILDPAMPLVLGAQWLHSREACLEEIAASLCSSDGMAKACALRGLPGTGKTALAVVFSHLVMERASFQGILWITLGPQPDLRAHLLRLHSLVRKGAGVKSQQPPASPAEVAWEVRETIGMRRFLVVIDDAWSIEQALACRIGGPNCAYLLTTRLPSVATLFAGEKVYQLGSFDEEQSEAFLQRRIPEVVKTYRDEVRALARAVGGLPLALVLLGNALQLANSYGQPRRIQRALEVLRNPRERMQMALPFATDMQNSRTGDALVTLEQLIARSNGRLSDQARLALRALSLLPTSPDSFSEEAALATAAYSLDVLDQLLDAGLLESAGAGRYCLHPVIADYGQFHLLESRKVVGERLIRYAALLLERGEVSEQDTPLLVAAADLARALDVPVGRLEAWASSGEQSPVLHSLTKARRRCSHATPPASLACKSG